MRTSSLHILYHLRKTISWGKCFKVQRIIYSLIPFLSTPAALLSFPVLPFFNLEVVLCPQNHPLFPFQVINPTTPNSSFIYSFFKKLNMHLLISTFSQEANTVVEIKQTHRKLCSEVKDDTSQERHTWSASPSPGSHRSLSR